MLKEESLAEVLVLEFIINWLKVVMWMIIRDFYFNRSVTSEASLA